MALKTKRNDDKSIMLAVCPVMASILPIKKTNRTEVVQRREKRSKFEC